MDHLQNDNLYALATRFYNSGDFDKARALAKHLLYSAPPNAKYYKMMGATNQALEQYSFAIGAYQRAQLLDPQDANTAFCLGQCYYLLGDYVNAVMWLQVSYQADPQNERTGELLTAVLQKMN